MIIAFYRFGNDLWPRLLSEGFDADRTGDSAILGEPLPDPVFHRAVAASALDQRP